MRGAGSLRHDVALAIAAVVLLRATPGWTQTEDDLAAARRLFGEGVAEEDAKRYEVALEKFRHVAAVKETANVRYRMATCLEALGRQAEALSSYQAAARLGEGDVASADAVHASTTRAAQLDRVVPRLTVVRPSNAPSGAEVRIDDATIAPEALREPIPLDAGHHTVTASAPGTLPFRTGVTLPEGGRVSISIPFDPATSTSTSTSTPTPTGAYIALGVGGLLAAGSVVSFVLRQSNVSTLDQCPSRGGVLQCPESDHGAYDAAKIEGPLNIGLGAAAVVALGAGVWWILAASAPGPRPQRGIRLVPVLSPQSGMLVLHAPLDR